MTFHDFIFMKDLISNKTLVAILSKFNENPLRIRHGNGIDDSRLGNNDTVFNKRRKISL